MMNPCCRSMLRRVTDIIEAAMVRYEREAEYYESNGMADFAQGKACHDVLDAVLCEIQKACGNPEGK